MPTSDLPTNPLGFRNRDGWPMEVARQSYFFVNGFAMALDLLRSGRLAVYMPDFIASLENG